MAWRTIFPVAVEAARSNHLPWFAIRVQSNFEVIVSTSLKNIGYEQFLPKYVCRRWLARGFKDLERPLFPGYVFARFDPARRLPILTLPGVAAIVGVRRTPVPVGEDEISAVRRIVESGLTTQVWPFVNVGDRVLIEHGPLTGVEGILLALKKRCRLVVSIALLQRSVAVEVERRWVRRLSSASARAPVIHSASHPVAAASGRPPDPRLFQGGDSYDSAEAQEQAGRVQNLRRRVRQACGCLCVARSAERL